MSDDQIKQYIVDNFSREDKERILYWASAKKDAICSVLFKTFKDNNLLVEEEYVARKKKTAKK